jgi:hypothetical protein
MAITTFGLNDALTVKLWSKSLDNEVLKYTDIGPRIGDDANSVIQRVSFFNQVCGNTATSGTGLTPKFILNSCARPDLSAPGFFMRASAPAENRAGRFCNPRPYKRPVHDFEYGPPAQQFKATGLPLKLRGGLFSGIMRDKSR